ncbi:MAG: hypothetical protein K0V04_01630 [Deltaproteobacteria bacterium]|nr:hypothetical protein [Deltaproteobacteria bacterium]
MPQGITIVALSAYLSALASPSAAQDSPPSGVVLMAPDIPDDDADERLVAVVKASVPEGHAAVNVVRYDPATFDPGLVVERSQRRAGEWMAHAVVWIDLKGPQSYAIYVFEVDGARVLGRRVPIVEGSTAAAHETLANIATSVMAESMEGPVTGLPLLDPQTLEQPPPPQPEEPEPPEPEPVVAEPEPVVTEREPGPAIEDDPPIRFPRLLLSLGYAGQSFANSPLLSHGLALGVAWAPAPRAFVGLRYDLVLPLTIDAPEVLASLRRHPTSVEGGYRFGLSSRWDLELAGRFTVDPIRRQTDTRSDLSPAPDQWRVFSSAAVGVGAGVSPIPQLRLGLRVGAEAVVSRATYLVEDPQQRVLVAPHPIRGFVEVSVQFSTVWREKK